MSCRARVPLTSVSDAAEDLPEYAKAGRPNKTCWLPAPLPWLFAKALLTLHQSLAVETLGRPEISSILRNMEETSVSRLP